MTRSGVVAPWRAMCAQALVPTEVAALVTTNGTRRDRSQLTVEIVVAEWLADDSQTFQASENTPESLLRFDPAENEVRVVV